MRIDRVVKEIAFIKNHQEESIAGLSKLDYAIMDKLLQKYRNHINFLHKIILGMKTPTNYNAYLKKDAKMTLGLAKAIANGDVALKVKIITAASILLGENASIAKIPKC